MIAGRGAGRMHILGMSTREDNPELAHRCHGLPGGIAEVAIHGVRALPSWRKDIMFENESRNASAKKLPGTIQIRAA
jgi:hypothetical protein